MNRCDTLALTGHMGTNTSTVLQAAIQRSCAIDGYEQTFNICVGDGVVRGQAGMAS
jgi:hypothetical protein